MACPKCGSSERRSIAPGYFECLGTIMDSWPTTTAGGTVMVPQPVPCGHRYHDGSAVTSSPQICSCGTFAIGLCGSCGSPVCGDCSTLHEGHRVCGACISRQQESRTSQAVQSHQRNLEILRAVEDRYERLTRACAYMLAVDRSIVGEFNHFNVGHSHVPFSHPEQYRALVELFPEYWPGAPDINPWGSPWDSTALAEWFLRRARQLKLRPPHEFQHYVPKRRLRGGKTFVAGETERTWSFAYGSSDGEGDEPGCVAHLFADGRTIVSTIQSIGPLQLTAPSRPEQLKYRFEPTDLNAWALAQMAMYLAAPPDAACEFETCSSLATRRCVTCERSCCARHAGQPGPNGCVGVPKCAECTVMWSQGLAAGEIADPAKAIGLAVRKLAARNQDMEQWNVGSFSWTWFAEGRYGEGGVDRTAVFETVVTRDGTVRSRHQGTKLVSPHALQVIAWWLSYMAERDD